MIIREGTPSRLSTGFDHCSNTRRVGSRLKHGSWPIEGGRNNEWTSTWTTFRPFFAMLVAQQHGNDMANRCDHRNRCRAASQSFYGFKDVQVLRPTVHHPHHDGIAVANIWVYAADLAIQCVHQ
jgi:hypothetical protein